MRFAICISSFLIAEEYCFINNLFEEVLLNLKFYQKKTHHPGDIIELCLSNFENNRELCSEKITELYTIFTRKVYCYGENVDNYELLNVNISNYHFDTKVNILQIRYTISKKLQNKKINKKKGSVTLIGLIFHPIRTFQRQDISGFI